MKQRPGFFHLILSCCIQPLCCFLSLSPISNSSGSYAIKYVIRKIADKFSTLIFRFHFLFFYKKIVLRYLYLSQLHFLTFIKSQLQEIDEISLNTTSEKNKEFKPVK